MFLRLKKIAGIFEGGLKGTPFLIEGSRYWTLASIKRPFFLHILIVVLLEVFFKADLPSQKLIVLFRYFFCEIFLNEVILSLYNRI